MRDDRRAARDRREKVCFALVVTYRQMGISKIRFQDPDLVQTKLSPRASGG